MFATEVTINRDTLATQLITDLNKTGKTVLSKASKATGTTKGG